MPDPEAALARVLPSERFGSEEDRARFVVDGLRPATVLFPESIDEAQAAVATAGDAELASVLAGCGMHLGIGMPPRRLDCVISTARLVRIVDHPAADMTVTAEAGLTVHRLNVALAAAGQWLPVDPPVPASTTVGGLIAANLTGPLRLSQGSIRDLLIGLRAVRADGTLISSGGRVVKNVAGYDLHKAFVGSYGTLGLIVEATFKVRPRPEMAAIVVARSRSPHDAMCLVDAVRKAPLEPLWIMIASAGVISPAETSSPADGSGIDPACGGFVIIGLGGIAEAVAAQRERIVALVEARAGSEVCVVTHPEEPSKRASAEEEYEALYTGLRDFPATTPGEVLCTVSLLPTDLAEFIGAIPAELRGLDIGLRFVGEPAGARLHLALSPAKGDVDPRAIADLIGRLRERARARRGHLVVRRAQPELKRTADVWGPTGAAAFLTERIKRAFDPKGLLGDGRFVGGL